MKRTWLLRSLGAVPLCAVFTFCGGTDRPPSSDSPDATGTEAGQDAVADARPRLDGSPDAPVDAPGDGSVTDAELPSDAADASADANVVLPLCGGNVTLGSGTLLALSTAGDDYGLSLSEDELSLAWATGAAGSVTVHYADRANTSAAFGTARTFTGNYAATRIALSPDGLGIAMVNADGLGFTHLVRAQRSDIFATPDPALFVTLNDESAAMSAAGEKYAEPLWFTAGILIFSRYGGAIVDSTLAGSSVTDGPFSAGTPPFQGVADLQVVGGKRRFPTSVSADGRSYFVFDQNTDRTRLVTVPASGGVPTAITDVGTMRDLQVSRDCKTFYFVSGSPGDIFVAVRP
ncbi:MAG: hypothetical protein KBF88_12370 [Polyangiaceae bacterium]|nr:hypothetical protein [Polyangiaceae bacterium]